MAPELGGPSCGNPLVGENFRRSKSSHVASSFKVRSGGPEDAPTSDGQSFALTRRFLRKLQTSSLRFRKIKGMQGKWPKWHTQNVCNKKRVQKLPKNSKPTNQRYLEFRISDGFISFPATSADFSLNDAEWHRGIATTLTLEVSFDKISLDFSLMHFIHFMQKPPVVVFFATPCPHVGSFLMKCMTWRWQGKYQLVKLWNMFKKTCKKGSNVATSR